MKVVYEEFETMPHCFAMVLETLPASRMFFDGWARFIYQATMEPGEIVGGGRIVRPKSLEERRVDLEMLSGRSDEEVLGRMRERVRVLSGEVMDLDPVAKL